ncbi:MAG TPA: mechanosensitive ion channel family protein [Smithellaceae bacterium]|nr:mechanosensitive ion channel family protein [Smithellaceae bacterium]HRS82703.1 mechanosensitive ion channel family protein [Smithellaceae bacterium]HRV45454.1 mechanosensitive ion channel family protein [Smithellaceae bacterium]
MAWTGLFETVYLGNSLQHWIIGVCVLMGVFGMLKIVQRVAIHRLSKLAAATDNQVDDLLVSMLKETKFLILLVASAYVASQFITIKPSVEAVWQKIVGLILIFQGGLWASAGVTFALGRAIEKRMDQDASSATTLTLMGFIARLILWVIVLLLMLDNVGVNITGLVAGLGIGGIAVALAVQNILGDLLASLSIVLDKPFVIGDFIVVDSLSGTVEHIGLKTTRIRSLSGEQLVFANNDLLKSRIRNYKRMQERRVVFGFGVVYSTPPEKLTLIKKMVGDIVNATENARLDRVHFKEYGASSLNFEVVYFVAQPDFTLYMDIQEAINLEIFRRFAGEGIEFAYPTQTLYIQNS